MYNFSKVFIAIICLFSVVSCTSESSTAEPVAKEQTEHSSQKTSQVNSSHSEYVSNLPDTAPVFKVAIEQDDYPPFEYKNEYGKHIGYDIDLIRAVGEEAGFKVQINFLPFSDILPSVNSDTNDIAISALTAYEERVSKFEASLPYIKSGSNFVVKAGSEYQNTTQLLDQKVAVHKNGSEEKELQYSPANYNLIPVKTTYLAFQSIFTGKSEALYADKTMLIYLAEQFPEHKVRFIANGEKTTLAIFAKKGNKEVIEKVNKGLTALKANGHYQQLNKKWFGTHSTLVATD